MTDASSAPRPPDADGRPAVGGGVEAPPEPTWITRDGFLRLVVGYDQAAALLADHRLHADLVGLFEGVGVTSGPGHDALVSSFLSLNGEVHRRYRALVANHFTPRAVERIRPQIAGFATERASRIRAGEVDFLREFSMPYVAAGTCSHIGIPIADYAGLEEAVQQVGEASKDPGALADRFAEGIDTLVTYARGALRGQVPLESDRVVSALADHVASDRMPEEVAAVLIATMLSAGNEPTVNQVGLTMTVLAEHPQLWDELGDGTAPVARVVEEVLRYRSTNRVVNRRVAEPVTIDGVDLRSGEQIFIGLARCNHDPARFDDPDGLDPEANTGSNLAFGLGAHYCLGASLARLQIQEAVRALTSRLRCPTVLRAEESDGGGLLSHRVLVLQVEPRS